VERTTLHVPQFGVLLVNLTRRFAGVVVPDEVV
jgi:hypothetical protein